MFEKAVRARLRFEYRGSLTVEDLWDLGVKDLDEIYKNLHSKARQAQEESLLNTKSDADKTLELKIEIVKYIVSTKLQEAEERKAKLARREKKQRLLEALADAENKDLQSKSPEELRKMLEELED